MRIIAGEYRSRKILAPDGFTTRPIPDRVKESVFGMLGQRLQGAAVVDLFAGSGAIGLEALSRGAASCLFVDQDKDAEAMLRRNIEALGCAARSTVVRGDALGLSVPARCPRPTDVVFFDPPYPLVRQRLGWQRVRDQASALAPLLSDTGFVIIRTPWPFLIEVDAPGAAATEGVPAPRRRKHKQGGREHERPRRTRFVDDEGDVMEALDPREWKDKGGGADGGGAPDPSVREKVREAAPTGEKADLVIPGCRGPETHEYGSTAVHFYMRVRDGA
ncbi:MAG: 16S rRNA (guanine(966)-N(2))-methyltransferase RsmD [Phycisphaerae bacterium]|nr:16S rRNA (guanine(966)-N(2))-methyltransferase RsmD [Phycisphaerae bacterium]